MVVCAAVLACMVVARHVLVMLVLAMLFAYLMEPIVSRVERWTKGKRGRAVALTYGGLLVIAIGLLVVGGVQIKSQVQRLAQAGPEYLERIKTGEIARDVGEQRGWSEKRIEQVRNFLAKNRQHTEAYIQRAQQSIAEYAGAFMWLLLIPLLAMLFPKDKSAWAIEVIDNYAAERHKGLLRAIVWDIDRMLGEYMWAQFLLSVFAIIAFSIALPLMGVGYWLLLAVIASVLEFIPIVGPLITAILVLSSAAVSGGNILAAAIFMGVWRILQDYVNTPLVIKSGLKMDALVVIVAVLIGGEVADGFGLFVAVPVAAAIRSIHRRYQESRDQVEMKPRLAS
jgi:predicted PurR-regulated permease PerM